MLWKGSIIIMMMLRQLKGGASTLQPIGENVESRMVELHSGSTLLPDAQYNFTVTLTSNFISTPQVIIGISHYKGEDQLQSQLMSLTIHTIARHSFVVKLQVEGFTYLSLLGVSYLALDAVYAHVFSYYATDFVNVSSGSGDRYEVLEVDVDVEGVLLGRLQLYDSLVGFSLFVGSAGFNFSTSSAIINHTSIQLTVWMGGQGYVEGVGVMYLILEREQFPLYPFERLYWIMGTYSGGSGDRLFIPYSSFLPFMMGVADLSHSTPNAYLGFTLHDHTGLNFDFLGDHFNVLTFDYLVIGKIVCSAFFTSAIVCVSSCPPDYTSSPISRFCQPCSSACASCSATNQTCSTCYQGYYLESGQCLQESQQQLNLLLLLLIALIPLIACVICACRKKKRTPIQNMNMKQHPTIQL